MATAPANDFPELAIAGEIVLIPVSAIAIGKRLRPVDDVWAKALGQIMVREGQQTPIEVSQDSRGYSLVAGAHRLTGARFVGMDLVEARIVSGSDAHRRQREISENLWRRDLDPLDRAAFVAELVQIKRAHAGIQDAAHREMSVPRAVREETARTLETISNVYGWSDEVGAELGFTGRTIRNDLMLYRLLQPSLVQLLREKRRDIATNASQLRALARLKPDDQRLAVQLLIGEGGGNSVPKNVGEALRHPTFPGAAAKATPAADIKRLSAFIGAFTRMGLAERKGALAELGALLPAGTVLSNGDGKGNSARPAHDEQYVAQVREGLEAALDLLLRLSDGDAVDDDKINAARVKTQMALMSVNSGFLPTQGAPA